MATLLVSDTSVLIDLERGGMLAALFELPFEVGVPDVMYEAFWVALPADRATTRWSSHRQAIHERLSPRGLAQLWHRRQLRDVVDRVRHTRGPVGEAVVERQLEIGKAVGCGHGRVFSMVPP